MLRSIAYVSAATRPFGPEELDALLLEAREWNASAGVTGVLFFHHGRFFQYLEGTDLAVLSVYNRILESASHTDITELLNVAIPRRHFATWHMGFCETPKTAIQQLANAEWQHSVPITRSEFKGSEGMSIAVYYWNKWCSEQETSASTDGP